MFDIGFSELIVIALVALIVIGPERLPKVARTLGILFGRMQRYVNDVKADISREMEMEELKKIQSTFQDAAKAVEESVSQVNQEIYTTEQNLNSGLAGAAENPAPDATAAATAQTAPLGSEALSPSPQMDLALDANLANEQASGPAPASKA